MTTNRYPPPRFFPVEFEFDGDVDTLVYGYFEFDFEPDGPCLVQSTFSWEAEHTTLDREVQIIERTWCGPLLWQDSIPDVLRWVRLHAERLLRDSFPDPYDPPEP
ncbi:hypothetical protein ACTXJ8_14965 [Corynebacterium variabile]|uniref:hypothetical protein n=1 Tax=Corynebacterium variabile TaxID=1727 RepID=UPI003FD3ACD2